MNQNQEFGVGDIAMLDQFKVKVIACFLEEDGSWWYEVEPVEFNSITREVRQERLKAI